MLLIFKFSLLIYNSYLLYWLLYNFNVFYLYDVYSLIFNLLTLFILPIVLLLNNNRFESILLIILFLLLYNLFNTDNLFIFFISFELSVILLLIMIILYGYRYKKYDAYYKLWIYNIIGSILLFIAIIYIYNYVGNLNNNILELYLNYYNNKYLLFFFIIITFLIKLPIYPLHNWLTLAHVEASTIGSVILASIVLKISIYGILKYNIIVLYSIINYYSPFLILLSLISIIKISHIIINQIDIKLIIAYSSILHTNYMLLSLLSLNNIGLYGSIISSIAHGFISTGLFISVGILYKRYKSRIILYYNGLSQVMVLFSICWTLLILSNISLPLTSNFIGECSTFIAYFNNNIILILIPLIYLIFTTSYNFIILNKIIYGKLSFYINKFHDLNFKEFIILFWLISINIIFGILPPILFY